MVYIGESLLQIASGLLQVGQKLFVAAADEKDRDKTWYTTSDDIEHLAPDLTCSAEEAGTRVWLHVQMASGRKKLLYSPDTDVYRIGLTSINLIVNDMTVQLSDTGRDLKLLYLNELYNASQHRPPIGMH